MLPAVVVLLVWLSTATQVELAPLSISAPWQPGPGDPIPYGWNISILDNKTFTLPSPPSPLSAPLLISIYDPSDAPSRFMWSSVESVQAFLRTSPAESQYLFLSYALDAASDARMMRARLQAAAQSLGLTEQQQLQRLGSFHFANVPMSGVSDSGANFLPNLMGRWTSSRRLIRAQAPEGWALESERLDASADWLPWPAPSRALPLQFVGDGCRDPVPFNLSGSVLMVAWAPARKCSYARILARAQDADAAAVLVSGPPEGDVTQMACKGVECDAPLYISATMVPHAAAEELQGALAAGLPVTVAFEEQQVPGYFAAIDTHNRLQQVGWQREPSLVHLGWAAQWLHYRGALGQRLQQPALVVPVFEQQIMQGEHGIRVNVTLPPGAQLAPLDRLELDFELSCPGKLDADCPIWDHVVQVFVCCQGSPLPCGQCDVTPWLAQHHAEDADEAAWQSARLKNSSSGTVNALAPACGRELGRWITPFRRRVGRWLTDATPLLPLLVGGQQCTFTAQTAPWALPWLPSLRLRFSRQPPEGVPGPSNGLRPFALQPLFEGGTFDANYNALDSHHPVEFDTPEGTDKAILHTLITGHGSDDQNCAEFCPTSHHFFINGHEHWVNFTNAGTAHGCADRVLQGVVPNEHGTWLYGRNGWCDGQDVRPWVIDVTADLKRPGAGANVVEYKGLYRGKDPHPKTSPGYIMQSSTLSFLNKGTATNSAN